MKQLRPPPLKPDAIGYTEFYSRSHDSVIRVYGDAGDVIEAHKHAGDFKNQDRILPLLQSALGLRPVGLEVLIHGIIGRCDVKSHSVTRKVTPQLEK